PQFFANENTLDVLSELQISPRPGAGFSHFMTGPLAGTIVTNRRGLAQEQDLATNRAHQPPKPQSSLRPVQTHSAIKIVTLAFTQPLRRSVFNQALEAMLAGLGTTLIRAK